MIKLTGLVKGLRQDVYINPSKIEAILQIGAYTSICFSSGKNMTVIESVEEIIKQIDHEQIITD